MTSRRRLPDRRRSLLVDVRYGGALYSASVGLFEDGSVGELFLSGAKTGSDYDGLLADVGVLVSRALQHGDSIEALSAGMGRLGDGRTPCSLVGAVLDRLLGELASAEVPGQ